MTANLDLPVPVWTLATEELSLPQIFDDQRFTPERLVELRSVLAGLARTPIATLEARPMTAGPRRSDGIALRAVSPLAQQLSELITRTTGSPTITRSAASAVAAVDSGEVLYRMVIPAKVAAQVGKGLVRPMASKAVPGGVYGALRNSSGIVANAAFVPVAGKATTAGAGAVAAGASGAAGAAAGAGGVAAASVITVAAPLVLMAVAVGVSAYAEEQRRKSLERITDLLEQLHESQLESERNELDGCRDAIDKATSILLDKGRIGLSLGLDSSAYAISTSIESARRRLGKWQDALKALPDGAVQLSEVEKAFPGVAEDGGKFRAHFELAKLAIALKRRVMVLQAVEHAQSDIGINPFTNFLNALHEDERRINELEVGLNAVLLRLSALELKRQGGLRSPMFTGGEVDRILAAAYRLRSLGDELREVDSHGDVAIDIERRPDGSLVVFPAAAA